MAKNRRSRQKYPNLDPKYNLKIRQEEISDLDYLNKLSEEELAFLNKFMGEYVNGAISKHTENLHPEKHDCYKRNNARNRDIFSLAKARGQLMYIEDFNKIDDND